MNVEIISEILYRHDPVNTGCNACEDMEDEYDRIARASARMPEQPPTYEVFRDILVEAFFEDDLSDAALQHCHREILALCRLIPSGIVQGKYSKQRLND